MQIVERARPHGRARLICGGIKAPVGYHWMMTRPLDYGEAGGKRLKLETIGKAVAVNSDVKLAIREAVAADAVEIAELRVATANDLTERFGKGFWSSNTTEKGVLLGMKRGKVMVAARAGTIVGTLTLSTWKPWAIDTTYFTKVGKPIYLTSMAVTPKLQGRGVGRAMLAAAEEVARSWPGHAIRLDAFDADAGAGRFYEKCGFAERGRAVFRSVPLIYFERVL